MKRTRPDTAPKAAKDSTLNLSIHRQILGWAGDLVSALIVEFICYRCVKNGRKEVYLKLDWIHEAVPYLSRPAINKKLKKLTKGKNILMRKGVGRCYHKCWYRPSDDVLEVYTGKADMTDKAKVYYNKELAKDHIEASVVYATILNLLKMQDKLLLDYQKLSEGSGLTIYQVRRAVNWLIKNKRIEGKKRFGNKLDVWLPADDEELPTESHPHKGDEEDGTEY